MWQEGLDPGYLLRMLPRVEREEGTWTYGKISLLKSLGFQVHSPLNAREQ